MAKPRRYPDERVQFAGVWVILPTAFNPDETLDLDSIRRLVHFMVRLGVTGVTVAGVLGEGSKLDDDERDRVVTAAVEATGGKIPVCVGTNASSGRLVIRHTERAKALGAHATLLAPIFTPVPNERQIFELYQAAASVGLPLVVQDHPASCNVHMSVDLLLRILSEIDEVAAIKEEAQNTGPKITGLLSGMTKRRVPILVGLGGVNGVNDIRRGATGFMTGVSVPEVLLKIMECRGDARSLHALEQRFLPLMQLEDRLGLGARKWLYLHRGLLSHGKVRAPGPSVEAADIEELRSKLALTFGNADMTRPIELAT